MDREKLTRQLMVTFKAELEEHLAKLNTGFLALEEGLSTEKAESVMAELFRAAHSLKGAARAVDMRDIETIAHRMEDVLGAIQRGELSFKKELFDAFFSALDIIREAMAAHLKGGHLSRKELDQLIARLETAITGEPPPSPLPAEPVRSAIVSSIVSAPSPLPVEPAPETKQTHDPDIDTEAMAKGPVEFSPGSPRPEETPEPYPPVYSPSKLPLADETIRVATDKLDTLMDGMGELLVSRMAIEQHLIEQKTLQQRLKQWQKSWHQVRTHYNRMQRQNGHNLEWAALLDFMTGNKEYLKTFAEELNSLVYRFSGEYSRLNLLTDALQDGIRRMRMLPVATLFDHFPRMVRDLAKDRDKEITLRIEGAASEVDRQVLETMKDPLMHLLRNAVDHGIEPPDIREATGKPGKGTIYLKAAQKGNTIVLEVADDGAGIDLEAVRQSAAESGILTVQDVAVLTEREVKELIFQSGLSTMGKTTDLSGRGVGLDVVRENLERLHGLIQVDSVPGRGTTFTMTLPLTLATNHVLLMEVAGQTVAVPTTSVERILRLESSRVGTIEGKPAISLDGRILPLISLARALALPRPEAALDSGRMIPVVVLGVAEKRVAFQVSRLLGTQQVVIKNMGRQLSRVRNVAGATILGSGQVVMILNVADLVKSTKKAPPVVAPGLAEEMEKAILRRVLVVDDSITTRTLERTILESAGYHVTVAADGVEGWAMIQSEPLDAVVADVAMPRMDGFELTGKIKGDDRYNKLPVVLVTSLESEQDKIRGMEAGANAYITKQTFDQQELLEIIERLIG